MPTNLTLVGFTKDDQTHRGTVGLLWQCLSTIFLCLYVALHFDIPVRPLDFWATMFRKCFFVLIMAIAPELLPSNAFNEWARARTIRKAWNSVLGTQYSLKQIHLIMSGGLQVSASTEEHSRSLELEFLILIEREGLTPDRYRKARHPHFQEFWDSVSSCLPSDREIDDRSKSDILGKVVTCFQALNVLALIIGRLIKQLDVSLLEIATSSYIALALISYIFWIRKPYNLATYTTMELPFPLHNTSFDWQKYNLGNLSSDAKEHLKRRAKREVNVNHLVTADLFTGSMMEFEFYQPTVNAWTRKRSIQHQSLFVLVLLCALLAGLHLAAWNYKFPTTVEAWMWRVSCIIVGALPWYLIYAQQIQEPVERLLSPKGVKISRMASASMLYFTYVAYVVARVYLIVEVFVSLRAAPQGIYQQPDWTGFLGRFF